MRGRALHRGALVAALLAVLVALPGAAQRPGPGSGTGILRLDLPRQAQPAPVRIELAVGSFATTAQGATHANALAVQRVVGILTAVGIPRADLEIDGYTIEPEYARREVIPANTIRRAFPQVVGYRVVNRITFLARDAQQAGLLVDLARGAGADLVLAAQLR